MPTIPKNEAHEQLKKHLEEVFENFKIFLETAPLYKKVKTHVPASFNNFNFKPLQLICKDCGKETTHTYQQDLSQVTLTPRVKTRGGGTQSNIKETEGQTLKFTYKCQLCSNDFYHFQISFDNKVMYKSGQEPGLGINLSKGIEDKLGVELSSLYKKGKMCEANGLGIASMAYYRRVVEDKVKDLLEEIKDYVPEEQKEEYIKEIESVKSLHNFDEKADTIYEAMPTILKPEGENLLKLLFSTVSENLHSKTDDECLDIAEEASSLLEIVIEKLNYEAKTKDALGKIKRNIDKRRK
ncbi:hypothetical protein [Halobacteriovorax sp. JY17]|uniref:hypothetical protein n=1 Tax=Halobacteriovorax sp. JY17 TaxID=2014617 RepID=UPI000C3EC6DE|nr:hypothetical protein [Halobacteriovorax sp. JY17]PIK13550.1 MAG: hypothetical protein CES88_15275 [Halobacteriovorax sp. JY17]